MPKTIKKETIHVGGIGIAVYTSDFENDFLSLTDIAKYKSDDANATICNWMRNRETIEFLGLWESLHNQDFKHSRGLEVRLDYMHLQCHRPSGLRE